MHVLVVEDEQDGQQVVAGSWIYRKLIGLWPRQPQKDTMNVGFDA